MSCCGLITNLARLIGPLGSIVLTGKVRAWQRPGEAAALVDERHDAVGHALAVLLPGQPVLPPAVALITRLAVDQQHGEVDHIEIGQNVLKTCGTRQQTHEGSS